MSELFEAFGINWKLLLVQAINFGLLLVILWRFLYTPVLRMIDERQQKIAEGVQNAGAASRKLAAADGEGQGIVSKASREAERMVAAARTRAEERGSELVKAAEVKAEALLADAEARAAESERLALQRSEQQIAKTAMLAAEKILASRH